MSDTNNDDHLSTISQDGNVPVDRIATGIQAKQIWDQLWLNDATRSKKRALVQGLTDGNPPYRQSDLVSAGRDYQCNVNWRVSEAYLNAASGAFYDLFNEAETYATVRCNHGTPEEQEEYSRILTKNFDWLLRGEPRFDYVVQNSQREMTLYGAGPLMFEDDFDWMPKTVLYRHLKVPEMAKSDTSEWELCMIQSEYSPDKLYYFISNEQTAKARGWDVQIVKQAIMNAHPEFQNGQYQAWEYYQQKLKDGSWGYNNEKTISLIHVFYREFPKSGQPDGKISHKIIAANTEDVLDKRESQDRQAVPFLFQKKDRYDSWDECIHPLYYDRGSGGYHHGVTGMGVKMYSAMEYNNRLVCNLADKAFAPKILFKASSATVAEDFALQQFGDYGVINEGFDTAQMPTAGMLEEGLIFSREVGNIMSANLGQYRQNTKEYSGEAPTARQVTLDAQKDARLQKTQIERYYRQLDGVYNEMYDRAISPSLTKGMRGGARAVEFRERCEKDGAPKECWDKIEYVRATRVVGQGSEFLRQQSIEFLFASLMPMLPETGRNALIGDMISARAGQAAVVRYLPKPRTNELPSEQYAWSISQIADCKTGTPAIPTSTQNPLIFASSFIDAAEKSLQSVAQGANPTEIAGFLDLVMQAAAIHLQRLAQDPSREQVYKDLNRRFAQIGQVYDRLVAQIGQQQAQEQEQQAAMQQMAQQQMSEQRLKQMSAEQKMQISQRKAQQTYENKQVAFDQQTVLADATTAHKIRLENFEAVNKARNKTNGSKKD